MRRGYARVSTKGQHLRLQLDALQAAGCEVIYTDKLSGARDDRPEMVRCLAELEAGDVLVVWKLDRLGRSLQHLVSTVNDLGGRSVGFESLQDHIETTSAVGKLVFHILAALAEFERDLTRERVTAGVAAARRRGAKLGRPSVMTPERLAAARAMLDGGSSLSEVARVLGISRPTLYRALEDAPMT